MSSNAIGGARSRPRVRHQRTPKTRSHPRLESFVRDFLINRSSGADNSDGSGTGDTTEAASQSDLTEKSGSNDKDSQSNSNDRPKSPPSNQCPICLGNVVVEDTAFTNTCYHSFCSSCIDQWTKIKTQCPVCRTCYTKIIFNVRSETDFEYKLARSGTPEESEHRSFYSHLNGEEISPGLLPFLYQEIIRHQLNQAADVRRRTRRTGDQARDVPAPGAARPQTARRTTRSLFLTSAVPRFGEISATTSLANRGVQYRSRSSVRDTTQNNASSSASSSSSRRRSPTNPELPFWPTPHEFSSLNQAVRMFLDRDRSRSSGVGQYLNLDNQPRPGTRYRSRPGTSTVHRAVPLVEGELINIVSDSDDDTSPNNAPPPPRLVPQTEQSSSAPLRTNVESAPSTSAPYASTSTDDVPTTSGRTVRPLRGVKRPRAGPSTSVRAPSLRTHERIIPNDPSDSDDESVLIVDCLRPIGERDHDIIDIEDD